MDASVIAKDYNEAGVSVSTQEGSNGEASAEVNVSGDVQITVTKDDNIYAIANGIYASSSDGTVTVETGNVTAESNGYTTSGVYSAAGNESWVDDAVTYTGGTNTVTVNGDVSASTTSTTEEYGAYGVNALSYTSEGENTVTVTGNVSAESNDNSFAIGGLANTYHGGSINVDVGGGVEAQAQTSATGVTVYTNQDGTASVTVGKEVEAAATAGGSTGVSSRAFEGQVTIETGSVTATGATRATGVENRAGGQDNWREDGNGNTIYDSHHGTSTVNVTGDVTAVTSEGNASGVRMSSPPGTNSENTVNVTGSVSAESKQGDATGINANGTGQTTTVATVGGDVSADASNMAKGAYVSNGGDLTMTVGGNVKANAEQEAIGLHAESFKNSETTVDVDGGVEAQAQTNATGLKVTTNQDGASSVTVGKEVEAAADAGMAMGVEVRTNEGQATVETGSVTATGATGATGVSTRAGGQDNWRYDEKGNYIYDALQGSSTVTVNGDVTAAVTDENANNRSTGIDLSSPPGTDSDITVNVTGSVHAENNGYGEAIGIRDMSTSGNTTTVKVDQDVTVKAETNATAISSPNGGNTTVTVGGNVKAEAGDSALGIRIDAPIEGTSVTVEGTVTVESNTSATGIGEFGWRGTTTVEAGDVNVTSVGKTETFTWVDDENIEHTETYMDAPSATGLVLSVYGDAQKGTEMQAVTGDVNVTAEAPESEADSSVTVRATGVIARTDSMETSVSVETGDMTVSSINENTTGSATAKGTDMNIQGGTGSIQAGNVTVDADGAYTEANGVNLQARVGYRFNNDTGEMEYSAAELTAEIGDVTAEQPASP